MGGQPVGSRSPRRSERPLILALPAGPVRGDTPSQDEGVSLRRPQQSQRIGERGPWRTRSGLVAGTQGHQDWSHLSFKGPVCSRHFQELERPLLWQSGGVGTPHPEPPSSPQPRLRSQEGLGHRGRPRGSARRRCRDVGVCRRSRPPGPGPQPSSQPSPGPRTLALTQSCSPGPEGPAAGLAPGAPSPRSADMLPQPGSDLCRTNGRIWDKQGLLSMGGARRVPSEARGPRGRLLGHGGHSARC